MLTQEKKYESASLFQRVALLTTIAACSLFLASCGGGSESTPAVETADGTKQALGVSGTTATVPGGWTGRAPKYEVINGITVPPEPAPSINNATLAGVDVNGNGVRDDVDRAIAVLYGGKEKLPAGFLIAKSGQLILTKNNITSVDVDSYSCAKLNLSEVSSQALHNLIFNTTARQAAYKKTLPRAGANLPEFEGCASPVKPFVTAE